jgi:hypothetical protein
VIQRQQPAQYFVIAQVGGPAVSGGNRFIENAMGMIQPSRTLIVEMGQRPLFEFCRVFRFGNQPDSPCRSETR